MYYNIISNYNAGEDWLFRIIRFIRNIIRFKSDIYFTFPHVYKLE